MLDLYYAFFKNLIKNTFYIKIKLTKINYIQIDHSSISFFRIYIKIK